MLSLNSEQLAGTPECFRKIVEIDRAQSGAIASLELARERRTWRRFAEVACLPGAGPSRSAHL